MFNLPLNPNMSFCEEKRPCYGASRERRHCLIYWPPLKKTAGQKVLGERAPPTMAVGGQFRRLACYLDMVASSE